LESPGTNVQFPLNIIAGQSVEGAETSILRGSITQHCHCFPPEIFQNHFRRCSQSFVIEGGKGHSIGIPGFVSQCLITCRAEADGKFWGKITLIEN
jgi:hypothetical protein